MKAKNKFLKYCDIFKRELADLQAEIDYAEDTEIHGTLAYIGENYSYELANICFGLGYATWFFEIGEEHTEKPLDYETLKQCVCETIISNEKIENVYNAEEINKIKNDILNAKIN